MHMGQNGEFVDEKMYTDKFFVEKESYNDARFISQDIKYTNGLPETKYVDAKDVVLPEKFAFQNYEEQSYQDANGYDRHDKKNVLKIKLK